MENLRKTFNSKKSKLWLENKRLVAGFPLHFGNWHIAIFNLPGPFTPYFHSFDFDHVNVLIVKWTFSSSKTNVERSIKNVHGSIVHVSGWYLSKINVTKSKARENFCRTNFEFLIFFQIFMIRFGRTELELRASFALNLLNPMLYSDR